METAESHMCGELYVPPRARGFILFASNRALMHFDRRQVRLAKALNERGLGTLRFDLVESSDGAKTASSLKTLTERLIGATEWSLRQRGVGSLALGYLGSGIGSAAALVAAVARAPQISVITSHGGRPDLAGNRLKKVRTPTLFVIKSENADETEAALMAARHLRSPHQIHSTTSPSPPYGNWEATPVICDWMEEHLGSDQWW